MERTISIQKNDTLWDIAKREYGDGNRWREIANANGIKNPKRLKIGQVIKLPGTTAEAPPIPRMRADRDIPRLQGAVESSGSVTDEISGRLVLDRFAGIEPIKPGELDSFSPEMQERARKHPNVLAKLREINAARRAPDEAPLSDDEQKRIAFEKFQRLRGVHEVGAAREPWVRGNIAGDVIPIEGSVESANTKGEFRQRAKDERAETEMTFHGPGQMKFNRWANKGVKLIREMFGSKPVADDYDWLDKTVVDRQ